MKLLEFDMCLEKWLSSRGDTFEPEGADTSKLCLAKLLYVTNVCTKFKNNHRKTVGVCLTKNS